jgi:hypothetical protein
MNMKKTLVILAAAAGFAFTTMSIYANHQEGGEQKTAQDALKDDINKDGKISFDEFKSVRDQHLQERFKRQDTNNDGFIDDVERNAMKEKWRVHRQAAHDKCAQKAR